MLGNEFTADTHKWFWTCFIIIKGIVILLLFGKMWYWLTFAVKYLQSWKRSIQLLLQSINMDCVPNCQGRNRTIHRSEEHGLQALHFGNRVISRGRRTWMSIKGWLHEDYILAIRVDDDPQFHPFAPSCHFISSSAGYVSSNMCCWGAERIKCIISAVDAGRTISPNMLLGPSVNNTLTLEGTQTDTDKIASTVQIVNQKAGAPLDAPPDQPPPPTSITAIDGELTNATISNNTSSTISRRSFLSTRSVDDYEIMFQGTGTGPNDRDGSIEGTAYLTFTVLPNATYDVPGCLSFCDHVDGCGESCRLYIYIYDPDISDPISVCEPVLRAQQPWFRLDGEWIQSQMCCLWRCSHFHREDKHGWSTVGTGSGTVSLHPEQQWICFQDPCRPTSSCGLWANLWSYQWSE